MKKLVLVVVLVTLAPALRLLGSWVASGFAAASAAFAP
jgi:hypothetical protein